MNKFVIGIFIIILSILIIIIDFISNQIINIYAILILILAVFNMYQDGEKTRISEQMRSMRKPKFEKE
ncbi:MAG: hypothetical protein AABY22_35820 [Nanoarchaeota archaeon]